MENNKKCLTSILAQIAEEDIPASEIDLRERINTAYVSQREIIQHRNSSQSPRINNSFRSLAPVSLTILFILILLLITPQGHVLAQQVIRFFITTNQTSYPLPVSKQTEIASWPNKEFTQFPAVSTATPIFAAACPQVNTTERYACTLAYAQKVMGFPLKALPVPLINRLNFTGIEFNRQDAYISLIYGENATLLISQGQGNFPDLTREDGQDFWTKVPVEAIRPVTVSGLPGEYVQGGFFIRISPSGEASDHITWDGEMSKARLRWRSGGMWFEMSKPGTPERLHDLLGDQASFIRLAESLVLVDEIWQAGNTPQNSLRLNAVFQQQAAPQIFQKGDPDTGGQAGDQRRYPEILQ